MPASRRFVALAALVGLVAFAGAGRAQPTRVPRVVVLGFDGASADRVENLMKSQSLPNLAALAKRGGYARLMPSNPAQSPVSWASMTTGLNPGGTGIYDFLRRVPPKGDSDANVVVDIGLSEPYKRTTIAAPLRAALVFGAGAAGAAAGIGIVLGLYAGSRRARRPHGLLAGTATGVAFLFAAVAYVALAWVPKEIPFARNLRSGDPFWVTLDKAGVRCAALEAPLSFPADGMTCGCCLSGLGTPDLRATWGSYALWTDDPSVPGTLETGGTAYFVEPGATDLDLVLVGPANPLVDPAVRRGALDAARVEELKRTDALDWTPVKRRTSETREEILKLVDRATTHVAAKVERGRSVRLTTAEGLRVDLVPGKWSGLVPLTFAVSPVVKVHGRVRFLLESAGGAPTAAGEPWTPLRLLAAPVQFDAAALPPNAQIASPMSFASDLARAVGPFETLGWPELTSPVKDDVLSDRAFVDHIDIVRRTREKRLMIRLKRDDWDCLFALFSEPDRVQHALYRHVDPKSPTHDPRAALEFGGEIDRAYVAMDRLVGEVVAAVGPETRIFVVSDHGFAPFRRGVNLNNFLVSLGLQTRRGEGGRGSLVAMQGFENVDWAQTKAYSMGLGNLYLNLAGRERLGVVKPEDEEKILGEVEARLLALRDKDGAKVVRHVYRGKDLYHGARAAEAPDLVVGFEWGYRVSWQNSLGFLDDDVITDNKLRWSGDHCSVDPELVQGVVFSSLPLDPAAKPNVVDVAPSILALYAAKNFATDGASFLAR